MAAGLSSCCRLALMQPELFPHPFPQPGVVEDLFRLLADAPGPALLLDQLCRYLAAGQDIDDGIEADLDEAPAQQVGQAD